MYTENTKAEVARLFFEVNKNFKHCMRKNFEIGGLTIPQTLVVFTLYKSGEMKISELSKKVNLSNSTVSGIVDRLEKQGMVERTRSAEDRRTVFVSVTEKFKEVHKGFHNEIEKNFEDSLSSGTPEELEKVTEGLNILKRILNDRER